VRPSQLNKGLNCQVRNAAGATAYGKGNVQDDAVSSPAPS
jgi:hypothetical protein